MNWKKDILYSFNEYVKERMNMDFSVTQIKFTKNEIEKYIDQFIKDIITDKEEYGDWEELNFDEIPSVKEFLLNFYF